jgi:hypothetical protein
VRHDRLLDVGLSVRVVERAVTGRFETPGHEPALPPGRGRTNLWKPQTAAIPATNQNALDCIISRSYRGSVHHSHTRTAAAMAPEPTVP